MGRKEETWLQSHWRPMMAVVYMIIMLFDFVVAPIFWGLLQAHISGAILVQWVPLTLDSGGIFYAAMGAFLGITSFTRGKENLEKIRSGQFDASNTDDRK